MRGSVLGHPVLRTEDPGMLTGATRYLDDIVVEGALSAVFVRSMAAHAHIEGIEVADALRHPGVIGVFTARDLNLPLLRSSWVDDVFARPPLATNKVRFAGEAIAVVIAETVAHAIDAAGSVIVDYDFLPAVTDPVEAAAGGSAPVLFPEAGSNVAIDDDYGSSRLDLDDAEVVVRGRFLNQRLAPVPMEANGCIAIPSRDGLTLWIPCQAPNTVRDDLAELLGLEPAALRVRAAAIGGGFGAKIPFYPEHVVIAEVARRLERSVKWIESRSENMLAMTHGRGQVQEVALAARRDGRITGIKVDVIADAGAYPGDSAELPELTWKMSTGVYRIPKVEFRTRYVATNTTPTFAYRGAGRPEATTMLERCVDMLATEIGLDPAEVRRRNLIMKDEFPFRTATGELYDVGDYELVLNDALMLAGYEDLRAEQARRRAGTEPLQLGIGMSCYVEMTGWGAEFASVEIHDDGSVSVLTGTASTGQGHATAWAQLVSATLGVPMESVTVVQSDTAIVPRGEGTMGSRSLQAGGVAIADAAAAVRKKALQLAAHLMEVAPEDLVPADDGGIAVAGAPERRIAWADLARAAHDERSLPAGIEPGLCEERDFRIAGHTFPFGAHIAVVEVDVETGAVRLLRHVAVDDCGRILNPMLVEGQVHGGIGQGVAQALFEEVLYDEAGNPLTGSLMTYAMPSAAEFPEFETVRTETPTPLNHLGAKGIGESGTVGSTPAVLNAVVDAVAHLGVRHIDMPLTPEHVWAALQAARTR
jgi:carbon-monoxide dehydrogenase large subunit